MLTALGVIRIENDKLGRTTKVIDYDGKEVRYEYGKEGERLRIVYPDGKSVDYGYDENLRLVNLISGGKEIRYSYDEEGRLIRKDIPDDISSLYGYDERGLLSSLCYTKGNKKIEEYLYGYDLLGNKTNTVRERDVNSSGIKEDKNKEKIIHKLWEDSSVFNYEYDSLSRLISVKRREKEVCRYAYDAFGNRSKMKKDGIEVSYTYDALDRLVKTSGLYENKTYEYDKRGNLIGVMNRGKKIKAYEYGASGRLSLSYSNSGNVRSYGYDGMGNRIGFREYGGGYKGFGENGLKSIGEFNLPGSSPVYEERYVLDRTKPYNNMLQRNMVERGKNKDHVQSYVWDFNAVFMEEEEKAYTYLNDELGSPVRLFEQDGENQTIYGYDEFGNDTYGTQEQVQPFGYTGYRYDNVANTYFAQAREYIPSVGRFGGEDWIKGNIEKPFSLNQYGYCWGNPIGLVDRDGKTPEMASNYSQVFDILKTGTEMAGAVALADSPAPGPMDLVALGILGITLVVSGGVAVGKYINSMAKEKEKARVIALEQVTTKRPNETVIYRRGNGNATNLTPRPIDLHTGLSYELKVPAATEYTITTMEAINATGVLTAVIDKPNHVSVRPVNPLEMMEWINSRPTAKENPYYLTKILASISIRDNGGPCNVKID